MLSQTEESPLINVSSSRPKTDEPFPCGLKSSNEMKKKHDKLHLQWPSQSTHKKVIDRTLALYQHGPPPKAGISDKWPSHLYRIHGIRRSSRRSSQRPIKSLPQCPSVGTSTQPPLSCFVLHNLPRCRKYRTQRYPRVLPGWKLSQPGLPIPLRCPLPQ